MSTTLADVNPYEWSSVQPHVDRLLATSIDGANPHPWLQQWSDLSAILYEAYAQVTREISENTADGEAEQRFNFFVESIIPQFKLADEALKQKLLAVDGLETAGDLQVLLQRFGTESQIFREENVPIESQLEIMGNQYSKIAGAMTIEWQGKEETLPEAMSHLEERDRVTREAIWRRIMARYGQERGALNTLYLDMLPLRRQVAHNAGLSSYRDYRWLGMARFDYTPDDCLAFHDAIEHEVVPLAKRLYAQQAAALGIDRVRPWDTEVDPTGEPLRPFQDVAELERVGREIFHQVDPALAGHFDLMRDGYLDLASRPNKAPGGYCSSFEVSRRPYIFMNAVGTHQDVSTLLHEGGHAFHFLESAHQPLIWNRDGPMEFCEVASMAMELLSAPYLAKSRGGFYSEADARRAYRWELRGTVLFLPYMAVVDAFQHWVYTEAPEDVTATQLDQTWSQLWDRFMPAIDYSGLQVEKETGWQRKEHLFSSPFYYVEYGLAQLGALQVWRNALRDQAQAVADYRAALSLGYTRPLPELFQAAGARFAFDRQTVGELMALIEEQMAMVNG